MTMSPALAALVVHDLKNALGQLEAGLLALAGDPQPEAARHAHAQCRALRQRFVAFLMLYREAGEGLPLWRSEESPVELLHAARARASLPRPLELVVREEAATPAGWSLDPRLVGMALDAALHNAARYARSRIELGARREGHRLVFRIDDDGPGPQATAPDAASTGLGTTLCRAVARAHDAGGLQGEVSLQPRPGGGARFELHLP